MPEHHGMPPDYDMMTYVRVFLISLFGAVAAYLGRIKDAGLSAFSWFAFLCEAVISSFVGLMMLYLCDYQALDPRVTAVSIALSAHFSTRTIFILRNIVLSGAQK